MIVTVNAEFHHDVRRHLLLMMSQAGIPVPPEIAGDPFKVCVAYWNVRLKIIDPRPRRIHHSKELLGRALPERIRVGLHVLELRCASGTEIHLHLSDRAQRTHTHDWLLNQWGIHHLHVIPGGGPELLFVIVEPDDIRFVDIADHTAFTSLRLPEIVLKNWPQHLAPWRMSRVQRIRTPQLTSDEIRVALRAGVQPIVTLSDGYSYGPSGGGVTTAGGSSARAVDRACEVLNRATRLMREVERNAEEIANAMGVAELNLRYDLANDRIVETSSGHVIPVGTNRER